MGITHTYTPISKNSAKGLFPWLNDITNTDRCCPCCLSGSLSFSCCWISLQWWVSWMVSWWSCKTVPFPSWKVSWGVEGGGTRDSYPFILVHNSESEHYEVEQGFPQGSPVGRGPRILDWVSKLDTGGLMSTFLRSQHLAPVGFPSRPKNALNFC